MHLNTEIIFEKLKRKSKIKYNNIIKNSDAFPNFLSTKHFYKRRNTQQINTLSNLNIKQEKIVSELPKFEDSINFHKKNSLSLGRITPSISDNSKINKNLFLDTKNDSENNIRDLKKHKALTISDKIILKSIIKHFENNKLKTHSLYNLEKKYPLNSVTESNYFFLFSNYKNKKRKNKKDIGKTKLINKSKISNSALISYNMMKKFNDKTNKILEADKTEGTKFSNNINEFRKQIINSYKDSIILKDINKRKINYDNAIKLLESENEKRIKKAFELEKEFYKKKYSENHYFYEIMKHSEESKRRKSKKIPTTISKKPGENFTLFSSPVKTVGNITKNQNSFKSINRLHKIRKSTNENNNISDSSRIYENNNSNHLLKRKISKSHQNSNKKKLSNKSNKNLFNGENVKNNIKVTNNKNFKSTFNNNIYFNYINNSKIHKIEYKTFDNSEKKVLDSREQYKKYIKKEIKERSKQLADSLASINNYYEYQPLIDLNSDMPYLNINSNNLKRVIKVNNIQKNLYSTDDDDLLMHNNKKLKDQIREVEMEYYTVDGNKKKYHLSFIKNEVKPQTIVKLNHMKNPHFGVPC